MKKVVHRADERGTAEHEWLHSKHSFSFADYYNPERMDFGKLRVLNDDIVEPGQGFGTHHHENMEIVSIVLDGALEHKDSTGNHGVIKKGEIQRISAGSGIMHSEYNHSKKEKVNFLQIWIYAKEQNIKPSYEQKNFNWKKNELKLVVSGNKKDGALYIHQDAFFSLGNLDKNKTIEYNLKEKNNGVYIFVIKGNITVGDEKLKDRDAIGISKMDKLKIAANKNAEILLIEVPMI